MSSNLFAKYCDFEITQYTNLNDLVDNNIIFIVDVDGNLFKKNAKYWSKVKNSKDFDFIDPATNKQYRVDVKNVELLD